MTSLHPTKHCTWDRAAVGVGAWVPRSLQVRLQPAEPDKGRAGLEAPHRASQTKTLRSHRCGLCSHLPCSLCQWESHLPKTQSPHLFSEDTASHPIRLLRDAVMLAQCQGEEGSGHS